MGRLSRLLLIVVGLCACQTQPPPPGIAGYPLDPVDMVVSQPITNLQQLWLGAPTLWSPPPNASFDARYFAVHGLTQPELIASLFGANLCSIYPCLPDPAQPNARGACALEGTEPAPGIYCYSPRTATYQFRQFILLPQWTPALATVKVPLVSAWNALMQVLYIHEATHASIADQDLGVLTNQAHQLPDCAAFAAFWANPHVFDQLNADQNAFHARIRADCRPEVGCIPPGFLGWT